MQKTITLSLFLLISILFSAPYAIYAASPSPSPKASTSPSPTPKTEPSINEVTENIKKRVQDALGDDAPSESADITMRGYVGVVQDVIKETLIVQDKDGKKKVLVTDDTTLLRSPGNADIELTDVRIDDYIIAIGSQKDADEITGRRLIVSTNPISQNQKITGMGTIDKKTATSLTLTTKDGAVTLTTTAKTIVKSTMSNVLELTELEVGDTIIYTGSETTTAKTATNIMRIRTTSVPEAEPADES